MFAEAFRKESDSLCSISPASPPLSAANVDKHYRMTCSIEKLPPDFIMYKHNIGQGDICRRVIYNGKCWKCKEATEGVAA